MTWRATLPVVLVGSILLALPGCGRDSGDPDYTGQEDLVPVDQKYEEPDPFQPGEQRLCVDLFYEGERSETIKINGFRNHYFIFGGPELGRDTYTHGIAKDRLEGEMSDSVTLVGTVWWGGGIVWDEPIDLTGWTKLYVSFKSSSPSFARFDLSLLSGEGESPRSVVFAVTDYGYKNDGEWHSLEIPLKDAIARGFDIARVRSPFVIGAAGGTAGDRLLIDNLYLSPY